MDCRVALYLRAPTAGILLSFVIAITSIERKPMIPHLLRYQRFAVDDYGFTLEALNLGHHRLSLDKAES